MIPTYLAAVAAQHGLDPDAFAEAVKQIQREQAEPVAYFQVTGEHQGYKHYEQVARKFKDDKDVFPLYLAPRLPSDEEIDAEAKIVTERLGFDAYMTVGEFQVFARRLVRRLFEKG